MLKKLKEPYVVGVVSRVLGQVISFVSVAIASRYLNLDVFGTYALAWAATVIGNTFVFTGVYQAVLRTPDFDRDRDTLFWLKAAVGALATVTILLFGLLAGGPGSAQGFALLALAPTPLLVVPTAWWEAQLVRAKRVRSASVYVLVSEAFALAALVILLMQGWQIGALIAARYVSLVVGWILTGGLIRTLPRLQFRRDTSGFAATTAFPLWGATSVGLFSNYGTDIILGSFAPAAAIGAYRGGARIAMTASDLVLQPLGIVTWSRFTRIEKENAGAGELRDAWIANMAIAAALLWPLSATVILLAPELVVTLLDETWLPAAGVVGILSISRAILFFSALLEQTMTITRKGRTQLVIRLVGAGSLLAMLLLFARFGAEAAAYAHLASSVLVATIAVAAMSRTLKLTLADLVGTFVPGLALTILTSAVIVGTEAMHVVHGPQLGLLVSLGAVAVAWLAMLMLFLQRRVLVLPTP